MSNSNSSNRGNRSVDTRDLTGDNFAGTSAARGPIQAERALPLDEMGAGRNHMTF